MEARIAKIISTVFNPLFIPTYGVMILFKLDTFIRYVLPTGAKNLVLIIVFINTAIAPFIAILFMKKLGLINNLSLNKRNERIMPIIVGVFLYFFTYYILRQSSLPSIVHFYFLGATIVVTISLFITIYWKISLHMVSMGGLTGFLMATAFLLRTNTIFWIVVVIFSSGLVGSSRLLLNQHTSGQVFAGYILGVSTMLILYLILR